MKVELSNALWLLETVPLRRGKEEAYVGRVPLNAPKVAGCSGNSPYIYVEEAYNDPDMRRATLPTKIAL